jgi:hypothetical protein
MSVLAQFWWNWAVQFFVALGTIGAVVVALLGDWLKAKLLRLDVAIENPAGVLTPTLAAPPGSGAGVQPYSGVVRSSARYFQLRVTNASGLVRAHQVNVWLLSVDQSLEGADPRRLWEGEIPLIWQHKDFFPGAPTIGGARNADLFTVSAERTLKLQVLIPALNLPGPFQEACCLIVTVQARSEEGNSAERRVRITWDGQWEPDATAIRQHVGFEILPDEE